jgi:cation diffusion facilitator CzcD-associated flavoprotein CzcO
MAKSSQPGMLDILIVGAGFAGLYMLHKARSRGLNARVIEAASGVGGTWFHNCYPGARVDIQSMEYSFAFSEELQQEWHWSERYAAQPELLKYANHLADRFDLRNGIQFNTRVVAAAFDESASNWAVTADSGELWTARFVVLASGPLSSPNTPKFDGLESFRGEVYHTGKWPQSEVNLSGKRVAVIGTGSSGVQVIPALAKVARQLTVFQRTASYTVPAHNAPLDAAFEARIKADYAGFRARNKLTRNGFGSEYPFNNVSVLDATPQEREAGFEARWVYGGVAFMGAFNDILLNAESNTIAAEFVRGKIRTIVHDPATAQLLCPQHTIGCKRLCVDTGYYDTYNRANVRLVDVSKSKGQSGLEAITTGGIRANGENFEVDAIVLATGFDALTGTLMRLDLKGRNAVPIQRKWAAGPLNYLGLMTSGFPNLFNVAGPGSTAVFTNVIVAIEHHIEWIADCIEWLDAKGHQTIEPSATAEADWVAHVNQVAQGTLFLSCSSWYLGANIPGKPRLFMPLLGFPPYVQKCDEVAQSGYPGFEFT